MENSMLECKWMEISYFIMRKKEKELSSLRMHYGHLKLTINQMVISIDVRKDYILNLFLGPYHVRV